MRARSAAWLLILAAAACGEGRTRPGGRQPPPASPTDAGPRDIGSLPDGCVPNCDRRQCGPDPVCGVECGTCGSGICVVGLCLGGDRDGGSGGDAAPGADARGFADAAETSPSAPRILSWATSSMDLTPTRSVL